MKVRLKCGVIAKVESFVIDVKDKDGDSMVVSADAVDLVDIEGSDLMLSDSIRASIEEASTMMRSMEKRLERTEKSFNKLSKLLTKNDKRMNRPEMIVVHCSATREGANFKASDIDKWHRQRGFRKIGYHYVIDLDGTIERGRDESEEGAHAVGYNSKSIGICYIGGLDKDGKTAKDTRTPEQKESLKKLITDLCERYKKSGKPIKYVVGHRDLSVDLNGDGVISRHEYMKECPSFNVMDEFESAEKFVPKKG